jgi:mannose-6-phosphate isomerase
MTKLDRPLQLSPVFKPKIWGRSDLSPIYEENTGPGVPPVGARDQLIGEAWVTDPESKFLTAPLAGRALAEVSAELGAQLHGSNWRGKHFPILAKFIFTSDWLSVQVHPDNAYAAAHDPGNVGKCEMWYIVRPERDAQLLVAARLGTSKEELLRAFREGTSKELLNSFRPSAGEALFIPPGLIHALGPGLVLFEVEQNSDLTYRLDDFGRKGLDGKPRPLHLDKGMDVIKVDLPPYNDLPRLEFRAPYGSRRFVLACPLFAVEEMGLEKTAVMSGNPKHVAILTVMMGEGRIDVSEGWYGFRPGDTWLIPPACAKFRMAPKTKARVLKYYVPDLEEDFRKPLEAHRVHAAEIARVVFG